MIIRKAQPSPTTQVTLQKTSTYNLNLGHKPAAQLLIRNNSSSFVNSYAGKPHLDDDADRHLLLQQRPPWLRQRRHLVHRRRT